jgi:hypothetical protein
MPNARAVQFRCTVLTQPLVHCCVRPHPYIHSGKAISFYWKTTAQVFSVALGLALFISYVQTYLIDKYVGANVTVRKERVSDASSTDSEPQKKKKLSSRSLLHVLKPYFWPTGTLNKLRCISTWIALGELEF